MLFRRFPLEIPGSGTNTIAFSRYSGSCRPYCWPTLPTKSGVKRYPFYTRTKTVVPMSDKDDKIAELQSRWSRLMEQQQGFNEAMFQLKKDILALQEGAVTAPKKVVSETKAVAPTILKKPTKEGAAQPLKSVEEEAASQKVPIQNAKRISIRKTSNLEKFIGENLINKIGILIIIVGVVIGAKYSIDNNLISPLTRILLGYLTGLSLVVLGFKLKKNYHGYSAVLVSGALASCISLPT